MKDKRDRKDWHMDENGLVTSRTLAEMIVSSLHYAKPQVISDDNYDRAVEIAEEEIDVQKVFRDLTRKKNKKE